MELTQTSNPASRSAEALKQRIPVFLLAVLVGASVFLFHLPFAKNSYLVDDSADYLRAAQSGLLPLYLNTDSASPLALHTMLRNPRFKDAPWDYLYFRGDNAAIRHFHAPFSFYVMHAVYAAGGSDRAQRLTVSTVTAVTCAVLAFGIASAGVPAALAASAALLAGWQTRYIEVSVDPTPHSWYMLFAVTFLLLFAKYLVAPRLRTMVLAAVALGFAFATLEFSLELILSIPFALCGLWAIGQLRTAEAAETLRNMLRATPVFLAVTFLVWPGGWLRGGYLEAYGVTGATVLFKNKQAFGEKLTAGILYEKLFAHHEILLVVFLFFCASLIYLTAIRRISKTSAVFSTYAVIALGLGVADHFRLSTYVSEFFLFLIPAAALLFADVLTLSGIRSQQVVTTLACGLLLCGAAQEWSQRSGGMFYRPWLKPVFSGIQTDVPRGSTVLVNDNLEDLYTYVPGYHFEPTINRDSNSPRTPWRASNIRYYLLEKQTPAPFGTKPVTIWPTYAPDHELILYEEKR